MAGRNAGAGWISRASRPCDHASHQGCLFTSSSRAFARGAASASAWYGNIKDQWTLAAGWRIPPSPKVTADDATVSQPATTRAIGGPQPFPAPR